MNPCFIHKLLPIYIAAWFLIKSVSSTDKRGSTGSNPNPGVGSPSPESQSPVTYIDIDLKNTQPTNQYEYKKEDNVETFTAKPGFAIQSYSEGTTEKWKSDGTIYFREVRRTHTNGKFKYQVFKYNLEQLKVKILIQDPQDCKKTKENDLSQYDLKDESDLLEYKFKDGVKCINISFDDKQVWKYDSSQTNNSHPLSALLDTKSKTMLLIFKDTISIFKADAEQWKSIFSGKPKTVELNIKKKDSTGEYDYSNKDGIGTYTAKDGYFFNIVKKSGGCCNSGCCGSSETIWEAKDIVEYATKVVSDGLSFCSKIKNVTIYFANGQSKLFNKNNSNWVSKIPSVYQSDLQAVELDVTKTFPTSQFKVTELCGRHTFWANAGYGFSIVKHGNNEIWKADGDYAERVLFFPYKQTSLPEVQLYFPDGTTKGFDSDGSTSWKASKG